MAVDIENNNLKNIGKKEKIRSTTFKKCLPKTIKKKIQ